ncbi:MAG: hypothetical protein GEU79_14645 [Acidimicrobiia bacterium]|nr:hypothetical protein [Acidimicrobiia bacterium]
MTSRQQMYSDVTSEYLALRREGGVVADVFDVVRVSGSDAVDFLDGIISQEVATLPVSRATRSFLLEPRGKLVALLWILRDGDDILLLTLGSGEEVAAALSRYLIRVDAIVAVDGKMSLVVGGDDVAGTPIPIRGLDGAVATRDYPDELPLVGEIAWNAVRIESGEPLMGIDVTEKTIPQETGLVPDAVSFTKGCYLGQELVARIDTRGHVNKRLMGLVVNENVLPPVGAKVVSDGKDVGVLTSVSESLELMAPVGLATVRTEVADDTMVDLTWDGGGTRALLRLLPLVGT